MKEKSSFLVSMLLIFYLTGGAQGFQNDPAGDKSYDPRYWLEGIANHRNRIDKASESDITAMVEEAYSKGWNGLLFWGADRRDSKMHYFYKSPFLETQSWAEFEGDNLSPLVRAAHKRGLLVMVNIEGVNPYHWTQNQWTPENIKTVAKDLADAGIDAVFEECFEVKPDVFVSLARELKKEGVNYISGTDPMLLREASFAALWPETAVIDIYNYYLKRDKIFNIATLTQNGSLGYGWAKYWNKPTALISPLNRNWGIAGDYSPAVVSYLCMIRALQFRLDNFIIFGGRGAFDPAVNKAWIQEYVNKQEKNRPLMNIVVLLEKEAEFRM